LRILDKEIKKTEKELNVAETDSKKATTAANNDQKAGVEKMKKIVSEFPGIKEEGILSGVLNWPLIKWFRDAFNAIVTYKLPRRFKAMVMGILKSAIRIVPDAAIWIWNTALIPLFGLDPQSAGIKDTPVFARNIANVIADEQFRNQNYSDEDEEEEESSAKGAKNENRLQQFARLGRPIAPSSLAPSTTSTAVSTNWKNTPSSSNWNPLGSLSQNAKGGLYNVGITPARGSFFGGQTGRDFTQGRRSANVPDERNFDVLRGVNIRSGLGLQTGLGQRNTAMTTTIGQVREDPIQAWGAIQQRPLSIMAAPIQSRATPQTQQRQKSKTPPPQRPETIDVDSDDDESIGGASGKYFGLIRHCKIIPRKASMGKAAGSYFDGTDKIIMTWTTDQLVIGAVFDVNQPDLLYMGYVGVNGPEALHPEAAEHLDFVFKGNDGDGFRQLWWKWKEQDPTHYRQAYMLPMRSGEDIRKTFGNEPWPVRLTNVPEYVEPFNNLVQIPAFISVNDLTHAAQNMLKSNPRALMGGSSGKAFGACCGKCKAMPLGAACGTCGKMPTCKMHRIDKLRILGRATGAAASPSTFYRLWLSGTPLIQALKLLRNYRREARNTPRPPPSDRAFEMPTESYDGPPSLREVFGHGRVRPVTFHYNPLDPDGIPTLAPGRQYIYEPQGAPPAASSFSPVSGSAPHRALDMDYDGTDLPTTTPSELMMSFGPGGQLQPTGAPQFTTRTRVPELQPAVATRPTPETRIPVSQPTRPAEPTAKPPGWFANMRARRAREREDRARAALAAKQSSERAAAIREREQRIRANTHYTDQVQLDEQGYDDPMLDDPATALLPGKGYGYDDPIDILQPPRTSDFDYPIYMRRPIDTDYQWSFAPGGRVQRPAGGSFDSGGGSNQTRDYGELREKMDAMEYNKLLEQEALLRQAKENDRMDPPTGRTRPRAPRTLSADEMDAPTRRNDPGARPSADAADGGDTSEIGSRQPAPSLDELLAELSGQDGEEPGAGRRRARVEPEPEPTPVRPIRRVQPASRYPGWNPGDDDTAIARQAVRRVLNRTAKQSVSKYVADTLRRAIGKDVLKGDLAEGPENLAQWAGQNIVTAIAQEKLRKPLDAALNKLAQTKPGAKAIDVASKVEEAAKQAISDDEKTLDKKPVIGAVFKVATTPISKLAGGIDTALDDGNHLWNMIARGFISLGDDIVGDGDPKPTGSEAFPISPTWVNRTKDQEQGAINYIIRHAPWTTNGPDPKWRPPPLGSPPATKAERDSKHVLVMNKDGSIEFFGTWTQLLASRQANDARTAAFQDQLNKDSAATAKRIQEQRAAAAAASAAAAARAQAAHDAAVAAANNAAAYNEEVGRYVRMGMTPASAAQTLNTARIKLGKTSGKYKKSGGKKSKFFKKAMGKHIAGSASSTSKTRKSKQKKLREKEKSVDKICSSGVKRKASKRK